MDQLRFLVEPVDIARGPGFEVRVLVNDVEMTGRGAGIGMDPTDLLLPINRLLPSAEPRQVPIARCACGDHGCGSTEVRITSTDELVHWDWSGERPMPRRATFDRAVYVAAVTTLDDDRSWETPERAAVRLVLRSAPAATLRRADLRVDFAGDTGADPPTFWVALLLGERYQVFLRFRWNGRPATALAEEVLATLRAHPSTWTATWHALETELVDRPPTIAGPGWRRERR